MIESHGQSRPVTVWQSLSALRTTNAADINPGKAWVLPYWRFQFEGQVPSHGPPAPGRSLVSGEREQTSELNSEHDLRVQDSGVQVSLPEPE